MKYNPDDALRWQAQERLEANGQREPSLLAEHDALWMGQELQVQQIELEMQNEQLQSAVDGAEALLEHYAELYDFAPIGYFTLDRQCNIRKVNVAGVSILGMERSRILNGRIGFFLSPESLNDFNACVEYAFDSSVKQTCEVALLTDSADPKYAHIEVFASKDGEECHAAVVDVTRFRQAEKALRESEARWQYALTGAGDGVWDWNIQTNQVYFSPQWKAMIGHAESEIGNSLDEWDSRIHPADREQCYADMGGHFLGEAPVYTNEHRLLCKDGNYKWILDRGKIIEWTQDGKPLRVIGTHSDISARKRAEEELVKAVAVADAARLADAEFLESMSHEIRTPLSIISGLVDLLMGTEQTEEQLDWLQSIKSTSDALISQVSNVLDIAAIEAGTLTVDIAQFSLRQMIEDLCHAYSAAAREKGLFLACAVDSETEDQVYGDVGLIIQILTNLIGNALKFTNSGDILVTVRTASRTVKGVVLHFALRDTGTGMSPEDQANIFNRFVRTGKGNAGGSGLGLPVCAKLVEHMGGRIWLESEVDRGSTFHFTLPLEIRGGGGLRKWLHAQYPRVRTRP